MKDKQIRVIIKAPGKDPEIQWIENELHTLQGIVGGYIEAYILDHDLGMMICNEEKLIPLPGNFWLDIFCEGAFDLVVGTVVFAGHDERMEEFVSLRYDQIEKIEEILKAYAINERQYQEAEDDGEL